MTDSVKAQVLALAQAIWASEEFKLVDTERSRRLRSDVVRQLLALVMTDDERAAMLGLPAGCRVRESAKVIAPERLTCGEYVWIGENALLDASGGLTIGAHTTIAVGALVWTHESVYSNLTMQNAPGSSGIVRKHTVIGSGCYIGGPSSIYPGVELGDRVVVLPMSVVTQSFPSNVMVGGAPARVIQEIDETWIQRYRNNHGLLP